MKDYMNMNHKGKLEKVKGDIGSPLFPLPL